MKCPDKCGLDLPEGREEAINHLDRCEGPMKEKEAAMETKEGTHTPTSWIKEVNGSTTRTLEEVAFYAGPNKALIVLAVNAHDALTRERDALREAAKYFRSLVDADLLDSLTRNGNPHNDVLEALSQPGGGK